MTRMLALLVVLALAGCVPRYGAPGPSGRVAPGVTAVAPGQNLTVRLENGGTAAITAGQPYVSALGESCVRVDGYPGVGAACLRGGAWIGLPDIFLSRPGDGVRS